MSDTQWADGGPSFSVSLSPAECLRELENAVSIAAPHSESSARVRHSLALAWLEWMIQNGKVTE